MLFDLDGTLYQSDGIYRYFAEKIAERMSPPAGRLYLEQIEIFLTGGPDARYDSDWAAVRELALPYLPETPNGEKTVGPVAIRDYLLSDDCQLAVSPGVREFLHWARSRATMGIVTNGPTESVGPLLQKLGIASCFQYIKAEAKKPEGLVEAAREMAGGEAALARHRVVSVGDNYHNDIAPAHQRGWDTGWITIRQHPPGPATWRGRSLEDLLTPLREWLQSHAE